MLYFIVAYVLFSVLIALWGMRFMQGLPRDKD